ncbi:unnamed protein product [Rangifer tarandus platyrhynchus]|uniref:Uncharacterized protein n=1 Tax=Rangifer tarandus platyrhynchus TaxID=3082113 RepID=A0AC60A9Q2_RANTA
MCSPLSPHQLSGGPGASQDGGVEGSRLRVCAGAGVHVPERGRRASSPSSGCSPEGLRAPPLVRSGRGWWRLPPPLVLSPRAGASSSLVA